MLVRATISSVRHDGAREGPLGYVGWSRKRYNRPVIQKFDLQIGNCNKYAGRGVGDGGSTGAQTDTYRLSQ